MELWLVTVSWRDVTAEKAWQEASRSASQFGREQPPMPGRKRHAVHVAVHGDFGAKQIATAGDLAIRGVVGDMSRPGAIEMWQPIVESAESIGSVHVANPPSGDA